jgi:hypothetical protein
MLSRHMPLIYGSLVVVACISATTVLYRALGFGKGEALYFACLTFAVVSYLSSRRVTRRSGEK